MKPLLLCAALALLVSGCGQQLPDGVAAKSGGVDIKTSQVEAWIPFFAQTPGQRQRSVPDAPLFKKCADGIKNALPQSFEKRQEACRRGYISLQKKAMRWVLNQQELIGQAKERGFLAPLETSVNRALSRLDNNQEFRRQLKLLSLTQTMARDRILVNRITNRIRRDAIKSVKKPSREEVAAYQQRYQIDSAREASAQLYQERVDRAISQEFGTIEKELKEKTVCAPQFRVNLCS